MKCTHRKTYDQAINFHYCWPLRSDLARHDAPASLNWNKRHGITRSSEGENMIRAQKGVENNEEVVCNGAWHWTDNHFRWGGTTHFYRIFFFWANTSPQFTNLMRPRPVDNFLGFLPIERFGAFHSCVACTNWPINDGESINIDGYQ